LIPSKSFADDLTDCVFEPGIVSDWLSRFILAVVITVNLLINVSEQVERLNADILPFNPRLSNDQKFSNPLVWILPSTYAMAWSMT
jgi:hypothetical protein